MKFNPIQLMYLQEAVDALLTEKEKIILDKNKSDWNTLHDCEQLCLIEQMLKDMYVQSLKEEDHV